MRHSTCLALLSAAMIMSGCGAESSRADAGQPATTDAGFDPAAEPGSAMAQLPFFLDAADPLNVEYGIDPPVDAWPVDAVIRVGFRTEEEDRARAATIADEGRTERRDMRVMSFDACAPVAAWVAPDAAGEAAFSWTQGWVDCDQEDEYLAVYSTSP